MKVSLSCKKQPLLRRANYSEASCSDVDSPLASSKIARGKQISIGHHGARKTTSTVTRANFRKGNVKESLSRETAPRGYVKLFLRQLVDMFFPTARAHLLR
jgi:hypothetical protein